MSPLRPPMDPLGALSLDSPACFSYGQRSRRALPATVPLLSNRVAVWYLLVRFAYTKKREIEIGPGIQWGRATGRHEPDGEQREFAEGGSGHAP